MLTAVVPETVCVPPPIKVKVPPVADKVPLFVNPRPFPVRLIFWPAVQVVFCPTVMVPAMFITPDWVKETVPVVAMLFRFQLLDERVTAVPLTVVLHTLVPFTKL